MAQIALLDQQTINKIAAGEVIERPASAVKELVENAIDANANAITVEIKEGGLSFIRITDNGGGIEKEQVPFAFLRHSTSKIQSAQDLFTITSLGFRGEALSSIAAVAQVELITKISTGLTGVRYIIDGGIEKSIEDIGAPEGTTFLVRNLFYNTPARRKFLKSAQTEASYVSSFVERLALSHPNISFKLIHNNQTKLHTSGNGNVKDIIYHIYGREVTKNLIQVQADTPMIKMDGFIGKPILARGNRTFENYFINGRYVKSQIVAQAIEDAYKDFLMQHKYPFTVLHFMIDSQLLDINVHPTKMELRFSNQEELQELIVKTIKEGLSRKELIPQVLLDLPVKEKNPIKILSNQKIPEPFEKNRLERIKETVVAEIKKDTPYEKKYDAFPNVVREAILSKAEVTLSEEAEVILSEKAEVILSEEAEVTLSEEAEISQMELFPKLLDAASRKQHRIIGQLFNTYWIVEFDDKMYIIDQHAAHEKVLYEKTMQSLKEKSHTSQYVSPPLILSLTTQEEVTLNKYLTQFEQLGFEIECFGGKEYAIRAVPGNLFGMIGSTLFLEMLDQFEEYSNRTAPNRVLEKVASMSCKAAVKGNQKMTTLEMDTLIGALLQLENPYHCPHGRPTIISMSKYEIEKKFKRVL